MVGWMTIRHRNHRLPIQGLISGGWCDHRRKEELRFGGGCESGCGSLMDRWWRLGHWEHLSHEKAEDACLQRPLTAQMGSRGDTWGRRKCFHFLGPDMPSLLVFGFSETSASSLSSSFIWSHMCHFSFFVIRASGPKPPATLIHLDMEPSGEQESFCLKSWPDDSWPCWEGRQLPLLHHLGQNPPRGRWGCDSNFLLCWKELCSPKWLVSWSLNWILGVSILKVIPEWNLNPTELLGDSADAPSHPGSTENTCLPLLSSRTVVLRLFYAGESPGMFAKTQVAGPHPKSFWFRRVWVGVKEFAVLTSSQTVLLMLVPNRTLRNTALP